MASSCCSDPNVMACLVKYPSERHSRAVQSLSQVVSKEIAHIEERLLCKFTKCWIVFFNLGEE